LRVGQGVMNMRTERKLLLRLSKLSLRNGSFIHERARLFSSSATNPYLSLACNAEALPGGGIIGNVLLFDAAKQDMLTVRDKTMPQELPEWKGLGASHGWAFFFNLSDLSLSISDLFNPLASKQNPTTIPLPPLTHLPCCQSQVVWNVAMSSSPPPDEDEDWVVAIKLLGRQLSLCRPRRDLRWTNILTPLGYLENSNLMFSKRDQKFYLPAPGGHRLLSYDLNFAKDKDPEFHELQFRNIPELTQSEWELLGSCCRTEYLVESASTGEHFLVKWYGQGFFKHGQGYKTKRFMVFREEETLEGRCMCYTEEIGDVCIFLSKSEAFCVKASSFPGLKPNSIYYLGHGFGIYDVATGTTSPFRPPQGAPAALISPY
ncbi:unnamed protein product, partial [Thlaspi arvense]